MEITKRKYTYELKKKVTPTPRIREQLALVLFINELTGKHGKDLIQHYIDLILPLNLTPQDEGYKTLTVYRSKKKSRIKKLLTENLKEKVM